MGRSRHHVIGHLDRRDGAVRRHVIGNDHQGIGAGHLPVKPGLGITPGTGLLGDIDFGPFSRHLLPLQITQTIERRDGVEEGLMLPRLPRRQGTVRIGKGRVVMLDRQAAVVIFLIAVANRCPRNRTTLNDLTIRSESHRSLLPD